MNHLCRCNPCAPAALCIHGAIASSGKVAGGTAMKKPDIHARTPRKGIAIIYVVLIMPVLIALASLAVDYGHVQMARVEIRHAAVAAARYGAIGLGTSPTQAINNAVSAAA